MIAAILRALRPAPPAPPLPEPARRPIGDRLDLIDAALATHHAAIVHAEAALTRFKTTLNPDDRLAAQQHFTTAQHALGRARAHLAGTTRNHQEQP